MFVNVPVGVAIIAGGLSLLKARPPQRQNHAVMSLAFFSSPRSAGPLLAMLVIPAGQVCYLYFTTLVTQQRLGYAPLQTGLVLVPFTLALILSNQITARLVTRYGERVIGSAGMAGLAAGIAGMAWAVHGPVTVAALVLPSVVLGLSAGLTFAPVTSVIMDQAPEGNTAAAASLLQGMQQLGGAMGLSVVIAGGHSYSGAFLTAAVFPVIALVLFTGGARRISPLVATLKGQP